MIVFLLKSSACLAIFLMFYKLFLENEQMHTFKRYYLLAALVLALVIPSITFIEYVEIATTPYPISVTPVESLSSETAMPIANDSTTPEVNASEVDYWPVVLWMVYGLGVMIFTLKFIFNLYRIARNVRNNPKLKIDTIINVLLPDAVVPHTFLNYIFLNRQKFETKAIPKDVLVHEATHARQRHSLDVLFVELLQIIFWFNPLFYFAKKSIKLNHEFLADAAVLNQGSPTSDYQNILLTFASAANYKGHRPSMANAINYSSYSSIKKRFKVMKAQTSKKSILVRSLLLLPLFALLLVGFSESVSVEIPKNNPPTETQIESWTETQVQSWKEIKILINKKGQLLVRTELVAPEHLGTYLSRFNSHISKEERKKTVSATLVRDKQAPLDVLADVENILNEYGVARIDIVGPETIPPRTQEGATKKHVGEYNRLAKKYNTMFSSEGNIRIKKSDVNRLDYLYGIMTESQRADAEPFPDFPKPPEPPAPPAPPNHSDKSEKEAAAEIIQEIIANQDPNDHINNMRLYTGGHLNYSPRGHSININHSSTRTVEETDIDNEVLQEIIVEETVDVNRFTFQKMAVDQNGQGTNRNEPTYFQIDDTDDDVTIYLNHVKISLPEMRKMEKEGTITSMKVIKMPNGKDIIELNKISHQPPQPPTPPPASPAPKSPLELLEELKKDNEVI